MDEKALRMVAEYEKEHRHTGESAEITPFIVWKSKILQNRKYMISTVENDIYYEITYNGDKKEWYVDAYIKLENRVIKEESENGQSKRIN